jgi:alditol oxidase
MTAALTNWAGNFTFEARRLHRPASLDELRRLVAESERIHPLGTAHSFSRFADTSGDLVSVAGLPQTIEIDGPRVRVAGAVRYGDLARTLHQAGWAVPNLASLPHISVAGAVATATHGSGVGNGNLATSVSEVELVTGDGEVITLGRGDEEFNGAVVALGALGVVTQLTLDLVPAFDIRQYVYEDLPWDQLIEHFEDIVGAGYSVCLFTDWREPRINQVWLKLRDDWTPEERWLGSTRADGPRHPVPGMPVANCTEQNGVAGPWFERLPHFRMEFTPSSGEELQSEYFVPRERAREALAAVRARGDRVSPVLQITEIRTIAADDMWLSPHYLRDSVAIHFTWAKDLDGVPPVMAAVEEALAPFDARPHWGKLFSIAPEIVRARYEKLPHFQRLRRKFDLTGKFGNDLIDRYLG